MNGSLLSGGPARGSGAARSGRRWWVGFALLAALLMVAAPVGLSVFRLNLLSKYLCFAIVALGIDLAWGYGGMLTLGQGLFFGLGGYAMGMYLKLHEAGAGHVPDFMSWSGVEKLPTLWKPFRLAWVALPAAILLPLLMGTLLGILIFRQRIRDAYFAILTLALTGAFAILLVGEQGLTGGTNGLTDFHDFFGYNLSDPVNQRSLYFLVAAVLLLLLAGSRALVASRLGRLLVATRDGETRVRFLGYNPLVVKTMAFGVAAAMAGVAGALFVPVVGIISPSQVDIAPSLVLLVAVAVGGRGTLFGAVIGAVAVNWAQTTLSEHFASGWLYLQGALFIFVIAVAPGGLIGLWRSLVDLLPAGRKAEAVKGERVSPGAVELTGAP